MNQGLKHLAILAQKHQIQLKQISKVSILPILAFVDQLLTLMKKYVSSSQYSSSWGQFITITLTDKQFSNLYGSWLVYNGKSLQCKLISTLLSTNSISKINTFLKLRRFILKTQPETNTNLDNIQLEHSDVIGILHSVYHNAQTKKQIAQGVKSLFISYKMQNAKICSCVFIQYALSLHGEIHQRENNQATITQQHQSYGTIPQSILGYSSILSRNSQPNNKNKVANQNQSQNANNSHSSQYVSNFQSIIHEDNGLYRKIKSSQVSLQGFKVIDHKFINNSPPKNSIVQPNHSHSESRINPNHSKNHMRTQIRQQKSPIRESANKNANQFEIYNSHSKQSQNMRNSRNQKGSTTPNKIKQSQLKNNQLHFSKPSKNQQYNSPTYSDRFKSPDMSYEVTPSVPGNSKFKQFSNNNRVNKSLLYGTESKNQNQRNTLHPKQVQSRQIKLIKPVESYQQQQQQKIPPNKEGGYQMFKKLTQRNKSFIDKMLKSTIDRRNQALKPVADNIEEQPRSPITNEPINVIHESIVRHSKVDRWSDTKKYQEIKDQVKMK